MGKHCAKFYHSMGRNQDATGIVIIGGTDSVPNSWAHSVLEMLRHGDRYCTDLYSISFLSVQSSLIHHSVDVLPRGPPPPRAEPAFSHSGLCSAAGICPCCGCQPCQSGTF